MTSLPSPWEADADASVAESGQSHVFRVRRVDDPAVYALKRLKDPKRSARFEREVKAMKELLEAGFHGVPQIVDDGVDRKGRGYYVMPWYEAGSLQNAIDDGRFRLDPAAGLYLLVELAVALEYIHAAGWAHRDLKPANVLLDGSDFRLADFGLALPVSDDATRLTATHEFVGSRAYLPPENEDGVNDEVDQRPADFYAFGKLTWALLAGRPALSREKQLVEPERLEDQLGELFAGIDGLCAQLLRSDLRVRLDDWSVVVAELRDAIQRITGQDEHATFRPLVNLEEIAARFASSRRVAEIEAQRDLRVQRQQYAAKLRANITRTVATESNRYVELKRASKDLVQVSVGSGGMPGRDALRILKVEPARDWDEDSLSEHAAALISADGMFRPTPNAVGIGCWVLVSDDDAYLLIGAYVNGPRTGIVTPAPLAQRYGSITGPFRLGLTAADDAAVSAGRKVIERADDLAVRYITALQDGVEVDGEGRWLQSR